MQPQMPFFLGLEPPPAPLTTTVQKCFRVPDIEEVGLDTYHLTFFEMLGDFSSGSTSRTARSSTRPSSCATTCSSTGIASGQRPCG